jgi:hypothetical protein
MINVGTEKVMSIAILEDNDALLTIKGVITISTRKDVTATISKDYVVVYTLDEVIVPIFSDTRFHSLQATY